MRSRAATLAPTDPEQMRAVLRRRLVRCDEAMLAAWLEIPDWSWVLRHAPALSAAGLTAQQGLELKSRLGSVDHLASKLVDAGRFAGVDCTHVRWWAAAGLMDALTSAQAATDWAHRARRYITACGGNQRLAALFAAAGATVEEARDAVAAGSVDEAGLETLAALKDIAAGQNGS